MLAIVINRLWRIHDGIKALVLFSPKALLNQSQRERNANLTEELDDVPLEASQRLQPGPGGVEEGDPREYTLRQKVGLLLGPLLFLCMLLIPAPAGMQAPAQRMAAIVLLMATWWICESIPIPVTSLLPIALLPIMGIMPTTAATAPYANHLVFLFMGGFIIALSMQRWNLHKRIAMNIIRVIGFSPGRLIFGFMLATAMLSAFVSNTATTLMMMPIGLAIITHVAEEGRRTGLDASINFSRGHFAFGINLMLGIAYAASIGGIATLIGTPPNAVLASYLSKTYGFEITFAGWLKIGLPLAIILLPLAWAWLTRIANPIELKKVPGGRELIQQELDKMGRMKSGERWTAIVFALTALGWLFHKELAVFFSGSLNVSDASIAIMGAILLFLIPVNRRCSQFVMNWHWAIKLPWGVLLLFGGGLALASGFEVTHLDRWIGGQVGLLQNAPIFLLILFATSLVLLLTELISNLAATAMLVPVFSAIAIGIGQNPLLLLIPAVITASCAFMLPVSTPLNAIIFSSGYVSIPQMMKSGFGINLLALIIVLLITYYLVIPVFSIHLNQLPFWVLDAIKS